MSAWIPLPHLTGLRLEGEDALAFAHAQFTIPFEADQAPGWRVGAWCNPKGKVISVMLARSFQTEVDLVIPTSQRAFVSTRLPLYAIGRKVNVSAPLAVAGSLQAPDAPFRRLEPDSKRGLDFLEDGLVDGPELAARWRFLDMRAGLAWLSPARSEQFLPQALGLEERGGLSYRKGCYPGQEVIARVHYLGKAKERLAAFQLSSRAPCDDQELVDGAGRRLGRTLDSLIRDEDTIGLAVVESQSPSGTEISCAGEAGRLCEPTELC